MVTTAATNIDALMPAPGVVLIAASVGGFGALRTLLPMLSANLPAAVVIVLHRSPAYQDLLPSLLDVTSPLPVRLAEEGVVPRAGVVYVAPADQHLIITPQRRFHIWRGPRIRGTHASANPLFFSAGSVYGPRSIGIVLTGYDHDGTDGVQAVARAGGLVLVQDPSTAVAPDMPRSAIATGVAADTLPLPAIGPRIVELTRAWRAN